MKRLAILISVIGLGAVGCGNGNDALSKVVGPNPISDIHGIYKNVRDYGKWSDEAKAQLSGEIIGMGASSEAAACLVAELTERFDTPDDLRESKEGDPRFTAAVEACGG